MISKKYWSPGSHVSIQSVERSDAGGWLASGTLAPQGICPCCGSHSRRRHGWRQQRLQDVPSHDTVLRQLKQRAQDTAPPLKVIGIDDWSCRKSQTYGTIIVDLERHAIIDILADRSVESCAKCLRQHPEIEVVSRDRCDVYAKAASQGAPQAAQVADRFHLIQNLCQAIEEQINMHCRATGRALLSDTDNISTANQLQRSWRAHRQSREKIFKSIYALRKQVLSCSDIGRRTGFPRRSMAKWLHSEARPDRRRAALKPTLPWRFEGVLADFRARGIRCGRNCWLKFSAKAMRAVCLIFNGS